MDVKEAINMAHQLAERGQTNGQSEVSVPGLTKDRNEATAIVVGLSNKGWKKVKVYGDMAAGFGVTITIPAASTT